MTSMPMRWVVAGHGTRKSCWPVSEGISVAPRNARWSSEISLMLNMSGTPQRKVFSAPGNMYGVPGILLALLQLPVASRKTFLVDEVRQRRKPHPLVLLGSFRYPLEFSYRIHRSDLRVSSGQGLQPSCPRP